MKNKSDAKKLADLKYKIKQELEKTIDLKKCYRCQKIIISKEHYCEDCLKERAKGIDPKYLRR